MARTGKNGQWMRMYRLAEAYYQEHLHLLIPGDERAEGQALGAWIGTQRWDYKHCTNPLFTQERIDLLEAIGMVWDVRAAAWEAMYHCCEVYYEEHGEIRIPQDYLTEDGMRLGIWLNKQRMDKKKGKLTDERERRLDALHVHWHPETIRRAQWDINFGLLKRYREVYGDMLVPADYIDPSGVKLGSWLSNQRSYHAKGNLSVARWEKLETVGMVWVVKEEQWECMYVQACRYVEQHNHLNPYANRDHSMDAALSDWVIRQRQQYTRGFLSAERVQLLEEIGMQWEVVDAQWQIRYEEARAYFLCHGHLLVSKDTGPTEERKLGRWISTQRKEYRKNGGKLKSVRVDKLEAIGMVWDASVDIQARWEHWFGQAEMYYREHGHMNMLHDTPLDTWVMAQKYKKKGKRGGLTDEQVQRLESIGIVWDVLEEQWEHMYGLAQEYYRIHEKLNIPASYITKDGERLGQWIARLRSAYKNKQMGLRGGGRGQITPTQVDRLNEIEMIWDASVISTHTSFQERTIHFYLERQCSDVCKISQWDPLGYEIDVYLPRLRVGIEYDGRMHADKVKQDEVKNRACSENSIRLIRMREPDLPEVEGCDTVIRLEDLSEAAFEQGLCELFRTLGLEDPEPDILRDRRAIYASYRDYVTYRWDAVYEELWEYVQKHGRLPRDASLKSRNGTGFVSWLYAQRKEYLADGLTASQACKLEKLGICWTPIQTRWDEMYVCAKAYREDYGDLKVGGTYVMPTGEGLGKWLNAQRRKRKNGKLPAKHIRQLDKLGMVWEPMKLQRKASLQAALDYYKSHGDIDIPATYIDISGVRLGEWLGRQRTEYRNGVLGEEIVRKLEEMRVKWHPFDDNWEKMYRVAVCYYTQHGNLWMSPNYVTPKGELLGGWISKQRAKYYGKGKCSPLAEAQLRKLELLGMVWDPYTAKWMMKYREAKLFYEEHGHLHIPVEYVTGDGSKLGMWLSTQRQAMRGNPNYRMTEERKHLLDAIGIDWTMKYSNPDARCREE